MIALLGRAIWTVGPCFSWLNISCQSLPACKVSFEKSADSLMGTSLWVTYFFSLAAFKIISLSLTFGILIMMCLGVVLFGSILFETSCAFWTSQSIFFTKLGKFSFLIFSYGVPVFCSSSSPFGTPLMWMLDLLKLSQRLLIFFSLFGFFFLLVVLIGWFCFLMLQIIDLILGFIHSTVVSL